MNLHAIAALVIAAVNPVTFCTLRVSTGYVDQPDGTRIPTYQDFPGFRADVQALTYTDLMKLDGLNIAGTRRKAYLNGNIEGVNRQQIKGGDLVVMPNLPDFPGPTVWLVAFVFEHWPGWTAVCLTLQNGG